MSQHLGGSEQVPEPPPQPGLTTGCCGILLSSYTWACREESCPRCRSLSVWQLMSMSTRLPGSGSAPCAWAVEHVPLHGPYSAL